MRHDAHSRSDETTADGDDLQELPAFELDYSYDERQFPSEVTLFPKETTTSILRTWLTIDVEHAVPLEEVA